MQNDPFHLSLIRDSLGQAGSEQGAMFAGGLHLGATGVPASAGDILIDGSIRQSTPLGAGLTSSVEPSIPNNAWSTVPMDTVRWDTDNLANLVANPSRLTIQTPGVYVMYVKANWYLSATGVREIGILLNAATYITIGPGDPTAANSAYATASAVWLCDQGDTLDFMAFQNSGAPLSLVVSATLAPEFAIVRIA